MKVKVASHARFGKCRVGEEGWIVGRDVARILGYANADGFVRKHVKAENKRFASVRALDSVHCAKTALINLVGLDELLTAADNPDSAEIKAWLISESARQDAEVREESPVSHALQLFDDAEFGQMRWVMIDGVVWFVVADLCRILDIQNPSDVVAKQLDDDEKLKIPEIGVTTDCRLAMEHSSFYHEINVVNEPGLYRLIILSRKPNAKKFQRKIYHEILPAIRKDGCYIAPEQNNTLLQAQINTLKAENSLLRNQLPALSSLAMAVVYVLLLSNGSIKIGVTDFLPRRIKEIEQDTNLRVLNFKSTPYLLRNEADNLESFLKNKFSDQALGGEFFSARFDEAAALIS